MFELFLFIYSQEIIECKKRLNALEIKRDDTFNQLNEAQEACDM